MEKVKRHDVSDWIQIIGMIGVIAGLLLITYEFRQNRQIARADLNSQQLFHMSSIHSAFRNREFAAVFQKSLELPDSLTPDEKLMMDGHFRDLFNLLIRENVMFDLGVYDDDDSWFWAEYVVRHGLGTDFGRQWWSQNKDLFGRNAIKIDEALERLKNGEIRVVY